MLIIHAQLANTNIARHINGSAKLSYNHQVKTSLESVTANVGLYYMVMHAQDTLIWPR